MAFGQGGLDVFGLLVGEVGQFVRISVEVEELGWGACCVMVHERDQIVIGGFCLVGFLFVEMGVLIVEIGHMGHSRVAGGVVKADGEIHVGGALEDGPVFGASKRVVGELTLEMNAVQGLDWRAESASQASVSSVMARS